MMSTARVKALSASHFEEMVGIRHEIHMHPELGYEEHATSRLIAAKLERLGIETRIGVARTGVVGLIRGRGPGKTVLLRADMDALPIQEAAEVPYKSRIPGRMHACGHDGHVAGLLGAAMILNELRGEFDGNIKLVFQPAEETDGGAQKMIEEGVLEDPPVDAAFGCHLWGSLREGRVALHPGPLMASGDSFIFQIRGKGGHGAMPHLCVDPISLGVQAISFMHTILSRRMNPLEPVVLTIGSIHSGSANNVIPEFLEATGTVRTLNEALRAVIPEEMEQILKGVTAAQGATYTFHFKRSYPAVHNHAGMTRIMSRAFSNLLGKDAVRADQPPVMGSEDFAFFCNAVPSAFAFVGIAKDEAQPVLHHHPTFQWDDKNLLVLAEGLAQTALEFLATPGA